MKKNIRNKEISFADNIRVNMVLFSFRLLNFFLRALKKLLFRKNENPSSILIFRTGSIGDSICAIPTISAIRKKYPSAIIDILTNPGKSSLVSIDQLLAREVYNNVINYYDLSTGQMVKMLQQKHYDLVIQLPQAITSFFRVLRDLVFFRLIAPSGWGWQIGKIYFFRKAQEKFIEYDNEVVRLAKIAVRNNVDVDVDEYPLNITGNDIQYVEDKFESLGIRNKKIIGVAVGAKRPQNRWPLDNVKKVITSFTSDHVAIIFGGMEDYEMAEQVCVNENVHNLCGSFTPMQSAAAFRKCAVFLCNDSGPMHLAYAVETPIVATFTSRDFIGTWFPPKSNKNIVFRSDDIPCSICLSEYCPNNICIQAIRPSVVSAAVARLIDENKQN